MSHAIIVMENDEGKRKRAPIGYSWSALAFGFFLPLFRGQWKEFGRSLGFTIGTLGAYWLIQPFHANELYRSHLFKRGFRPVELEGVTISDLERRLGLPLQASVELGGRETRITSALEDGASSGEKAGFLKKYWGWLIFAAFAVVLVAFSSYEDNRLQELRSSDPAAYLAEIEGEPNYMEELKELDPAKYEALIVGQWKILFEAGRYNSADYVEKLYSFMIVSDEALADAVNSGRITPLEYQRIWNNNYMYARTIPYSVRRISEGDFDTIIERGIIFRLSRDCGNEAGYEGWDTSLQDEAEVKAWPLLDRLDWAFESNGFAPYATQIYYGAFVPKTLPRSYLPDPENLSRSCASLRSLVTKNRFYNKWNVASPEEDESDY